MEMYIIIMGLIVIAGWVVRDYIRDEEDDDQW